MRILKSIVGMLTSRVGMQTSKEPENPSFVDPTVYLIETSKQEYSGQIIHQDYVVIKLQTDKPQPVKILKSNIKRITIVSTKVVQRNLQWKSLRLQHSG